VAYVVTEPCIKCKYTECVQNCPVVCFHEGANFLVIDPDDCIDCGACVDPCPVNAIYRVEDLPAKWSHYIELNQRFAREWPELTQMREPLPTAEEFAGVGDKEALLDPAPGAGDAG